MGAETLTVACVYRPGGGFDDSYVYKLRDAFGRHLHVPHRFVCLTNRPLTVDRIPLERRWPGWWSKLELFRAGLFSGPVFYTDLDTVIVSDVTDIATAAYDFACGTNWKGCGTHISSAVMAWDGRTDLSNIYQSFDLAAVERYEQSWERWGDQGWIQDHLNRPFKCLLKRWPNRIVHTKTHVWKGRHATNAPAPKDASIVCFSGRPRPHELPPGNPLLRAWNGEH